MSRYVALHLLTFVLLHFSGALPTLAEVFNPVNGKLIKGTSIEQIIVSDAMFDLLQYLLLMILFSLIFIFAHALLARKVHRLLFSKTDPFVIHLTGSTISTLALLIVNSTLFSNSIFYIPEQLSVSLYSYSFYLLSSCCSV